MKLDSSPPEDLARGQTLLACDHRGEGLERVVTQLRSHGFRIETTHSLQQTAEHLARGPFGLILVDPLAQGGTVELEALDRARAGEPEVPLLIAVEDSDPEPAVQAARKLVGELWDLVYRGAPIDEFLFRIERLQARVREREELGRWRHRASHDDRTELLRPHAFQRRLEEHFSAAQRHDFELALILIDLDRFGQVNKDHDHTVGDQLIGRVGQIIRATLRAEDCAGRLGGDEFGVLLPYTGKLETVGVVNRLLADIREATGPDGNPGVRVTASLGFETFSGHDLEDVRSLRRNAEQALRSAKHHGGDCGLYYRSRDQSRGREELARA